MNRDEMTSRLPPLIAVSLAMALAACTPEPPPEEPPLKGAMIGGDFALTGEDGKTRRWSDFAGKWRIVYFGYTFCPDVCPTDTQRAMAGLKAFEKSHPELGADIQPIFITFDPARDTAPVLDEFTANFHPRLLGLTGTEADIAKAAKAFAVPYSKGAVQPGGGYLMEHVSYTYLFNREGQPIATLPTDQGPAAVTAELEKWVR